MASHSFFFRQTLLGRCEPVGLIFLQTFLLGLTFSVCLAVPDSAGVSDAKTTGAIDVSAKAAINMYPHLDKLCPLTLCTPVKLINKVAFLFNFIHEGLKNNSVDKRSQRVWARGRKGCMD